MKSSRDFVAAIAHALLFYNARFFDPQPGVEFPGRGPSRHGAAAC
jgi:hypothetical protein